MKILFNLSPYNQQRQTYKPSNIYPVLLAMYATYLKNRGDEVAWDGEDDGSYDKRVSNEKDIDVAFLELPSPDREFTQAKHPKFQENGNFKYLPGTYIQSALDCYYGKCTFCAWAEAYPFVKTRSVDSVIEEIGMCIQQGYRELFDDSGTFPYGLWMLKFCDEMIKRGYNKKVKIGCNMRLDYLHPNENGMRYMKEAGFRMILYGLESANQTTLDFINKGINIHSAIDDVKRSARAGLDAHLTVMFGYPWETHEDALKTLNLVKYLLIKGYAKTAQATILTPYPKTPLYKEYPVIIPTYDCQKLCKRIYEAGFYPEFWWHRVVAIRTKDDLRYLWRGIKKAFQ